MALLLVTFLFQQALSFFSKLRNYTFWYHLLETVCLEQGTIARLRNHNATDDGNVDFRLLKKFCIQSLENKCTVVDLLAQKLLND